MFFLFVLLSGCGAAKTDGQNVRENFESISEFESHIKIIANLEESLMEYEIDYVYNKEENDSFVITSPTSLAGIGGSIAGTDSVRFSLTYDDVMLDDAMPGRIGFTPADCFYCLLADVRNKEPIQIWTEEANGEKLIVMRFEDANENTAKQIWLTNDGKYPVCAELYTENKCVLTIQVMQISEMK